MCKCGHSDDCAPCLSCSDYNEETDSCELESSDEE